MERASRQFQPDKITAYFRLEWVNLLLITLSGLLYNLGLLAGPWFEGKLAQCLADILDGNKTAAAMVYLVLSYITVTLPDNSRYPLRGLVDFADPQVDPETGTFSVRAEMPNPDHILLPGQFTKVKLLLDVRENAVVVPSKAIVIEKGGAYIFVVRPDSVVEKRFIETGPELDNKTVVERGLLSGERIVVEGYHKLNHGMRVEAVEPWRDNGVASN